MLTKLGKAMGPSFQFPGLGGIPGAEGETEEGEAEEEAGEEAEEDTLHAAASAGPQIQQQRFMHKGFPRRTTASVWQATADGLPRVQTQ